VILSERAGPWMASDLPADGTVVSGDEAADRVEQALSRIEAAGERSRDVERRVADRLDTLIARVGSALDQGASR